METITKIVSDYFEAKKNKLTEHKAFLKVKKYLEDIYNEQGISSLSETMVKITDACCVKAKEAESFAKGFFNIVAGGGDSFSDEEVLLFEKLSERFPSSAKLAEMLADVYGIIVIETQSEEYAQKLEILSKNNPALMGAALQRAYSLYYLYQDESVGLEKYTQAVNKIKEIYEMHKQSDFAKLYSAALTRLLYKQGEDEAQQTLIILKGLVSEWQDSSIGSNYLDALSKFTWKQDKEGCAETIQLMESFWDVDTFKKVSLAMNLSYTLANYSLCVENAEKEAVINRVDELSEYWEPAKKMAYELSMGIYPYAHKPAKAK